MPHVARQMQCQITTWVGGAVNGLPEKFIVRLGFNLVGHIAQIATGYDSYVGDNSGTHFTLLQDSVVRILHQFKIRTLH